MKAPRMEYSKQFEEQIFEFKRQCDIKKGFIPLKAFCSKSLGISHSSLLLMQRKGNLTSKLYSKIVKKINKTKK